ncbi:MAG: WD40/YVTN/BNR-like repeat-containing protein [Fimbriimonadaceae bacterium]
MTRYSMFAWALTALGPLALFAPASGRNIPATVKVTDAPYRWKSVAIVAGGFVSGILFHPAERGLAYCRTDIGGAYRWDARTSRWVPLLDWLTKPDWNLYGIESIGLDPSDPRRLYLACGTYTNQWGGNGAILRSTDQGRSFLRTDLPFKNGGNEDGRSIGERLAVDPNDGAIVFFGTRDNGLWRSANHGATWAQVAGFPIKGRTNGIGVGVVLFDPRSGVPGRASRTIYACVAELDGGIYRSTDAGATWTKVPNQPDGLMAHHAALTSDGTLYVTLANGPGPNGITNGAVYADRTSTDEWTDITPVKPDAGHTFGYAGLSIDPHHPETVLVSTLDRWNPGDDVFRSEDGGRTWFGLRENSSRDSRLAPYMKWGKDSATFGWWTGALALDPFNAAHVEYGTGANIWTCSDVGTVAGATHWTVGGVGIEETADIDLLSPGAGAHLISGLGDIGGFTHTNLDKPAPGGMTVNPMLNNTDSLDSAANVPLVDVRVGRAGPGQRHGGYSKDGGRSWKPFPTEPPGRGSGSVAISADAKSIVWAPQGGKPSVSKDFGATWQPCQALPSGARVVADPVSPLTIYGVAGGSMFISEDGGVTFTPGAKDLPQRHGTLRAAPGHGRDLWLPTDAGLLRSTDAGRTFRNVTGVDSADAVGFGKAAPGRQFPAIYLNGSINHRFGIFRSDDAALSWVKITDAQHEYGTCGVVIGDPRLYGRVYMGTNGRGVLYGDPKH